MWLAVIAGESVYANVRLRFANRTSGPNMKLIFRSGLLRWKIKLKTFKRKMQL